ncbi:MAG: hypothetical protein M2R45_05132 [Verrucomicrobia subdivision 3 bacterium]|nr:hypothetical protein [Limisphaerales bacterium]MCS1417194.1 hypothetical protein [Limisphaerales bacterium]
MKKWLKFAPPPAPIETAVKVEITAWELEEPFESSFHDLDLGPDGLVYAVNINKHRLTTLDPKTGEQITHPFLRGSYGLHHGAGQ